MDREAAGDDDELLAERDIVELERERTSQHNVNMIMRCRQERIPAKLLVADKRYCGGHLLVTLHILSHKEPILHCVDRFKKLM